MSGSTSDLMGYYSFKKKSNNLMNYCSLIKKIQQLMGYSSLAKKNLAIMKLLEHIQYTKSSNFS